MPTSEQRSPPGLRVLVIEDDENVRRFLEASLTGLGHRPVLTADAQQGLEAFAPIASTWCSPISVCREPMAGKWPG